MNKGKEQLFQEAKNVLPEYEREAGNEELNRKGWPVSRCLSDTVNNLQANDPNNDIPPYSNELEAEFKEWLEGGN